MSERMAPMTPHHRLGLSRNLALLGIVLLMGCSASGRRDSRGRDAGPRRDAAVVPACTDPRDSDGDGIADAQDQDDDGDGMPDLQDPDDNEDHVVADASAFDGDFEEIDEGNGFDAADVDDQPPAADDEHDDDGN